MVRIALGVVVPFAAAGALLFLATGDPSPAVMLLGTAIATVAMIAVLREAMRP